MLDLRIEVRFFALRYYIVIPTCIVRLMHQHVYVSVDGSETNHAVNL